MALTDACAQGADSLKVLGAALQSVAARPIQVQGSGGGAGMTADTIKRGQNPKEIAALKKALGL